jgi:hypothetical protein
MRRIAQIGTVFVATLAGAAFAEGEKEQEREPLVYDFVAVVNVDSLDERLRERVGLGHVEGPVLIAHGELSANFEGLYIRHDVTDPARGPLSDFRELGLVDSRYFAEGMPAIATDDLDVAALADLASPGLPSEDLRVVIDTQYISDDVALKMPAAFIDAPLLALSTQDAALDAFSPVVSFRDLYYLVDPASFASEFEESIAPEPETSAFVGLLCDRAERDECRISDQVGSRSDTWIQWIPESVEDAATEGDNKNTTSRAK